MRLGRETENAHVKLAIFIKTIPTLLFIQSRRSFHVSSRNPICLGLFDKICLVRNCLLNHHTSPMLSIFIHNFLHIQLPPLLPLLLNLVYTTFCDDGIGLFFRPFHNLLRCELRQILNGQPPPIRKGVSPLVRNNLLLDHCTLLIERLL